MNFKKVCLYIFLITFLLLNLTIIYGAYTNKNNIQNYFRIHVVANSDSISDQLLKYTVVKEVDEYVHALTSSSTSKEESKQIIQSNIQNILNICNNVIKEENCNYYVKAYIGNIYYDEKEAYYLHMDKGIYDSLKIVIGDGNGENWWSLIYPNNYLESTQEESTDIEFSFGFLEFITNIFAENDKQL